MRTFTIITKRLVSFLFVIGCIAWFTACSNPSDAPETILDHAIAAMLETEKFAFQGHSQVHVAGITVLNHVTFEGLVSNDEQQYMKVNKANNHLLPEGSSFDEHTELSGNWNPLRQLQLLKSFKSAVNINNELSTAAITVIEATVNPQEITKNLKNELQQQKRSFALEPYIRDLQIRYPLTEKELEAMRAEMQQSITAAGSKLDEMLQTFAAASDYRLWVDRSTGLPKKMEVSTDFQYMIGGKDRQETLKSEFIFNDNKI
jgi:hypothetical protein